MLCACWRQLNGWDPTLHHIAQRGPKPRSKPNQLFIDCLLPIICCTLHFQKSSFAELFLGCLGGGAGHDSRSTYPPSPFGVLAAHKMTGTGPLASYLAGPGDLDPFAQTLVSFLFRHLVNSFKITRKPCIVGSFRALSRHRCANSPKKAQTPPYDFPVVRPPSGKSERQYSQGYDRLAS